METYRDSYITRTGMIVKEILGLLAVAIDLLANATVDCLLSSAMFHQSREETTYLCSKSVVEPGFITRRKHLP